MRCDVDSLVPKKIVKRKIKRWEPRLRCHPEVTPDQTVPDESYLWSVPPRPKYPLIRLKCARNTVCALSAQETVSDQTFPDRKDLWSDHNQTIVQTIVRPWPSPSPNHCSNDCALKITSDQTIVRSKVTPDQTIVRSKSPHRTNCYNIFILYKVMFALLYSSKEKTILKVLMLKKR